MSSFFISFQPYLLAGYLVGGGWTLQPEDWSKHNAILQDLVNRPWPIYYMDAKNPSMLSYYLGFYLVPGFIGKIFSSFRVAEISIYFWSVLGLFFIFLNLLKILNATSFGKQISIVFIVLFFNGALILAQQFYEVASGISCDSLQWMTSQHGSQLQYRSNFVSLRWVSPQCLPIWLIVTIWWNMRSQIKHYVCLLIPAILYSAFGFLSIVIIALNSAIFLKFHNKIPFLKWIKEIFSLENVLAGIFIGCIFVSYYAGNVFGIKDSAVSFKFQTINIVIYFLFVLFMFGIYFFIIWKDIKYNCLSIGAVITLILLPFFSIGKFNDLVICGSIPGMFIVMICVINYLFHGKNALSKGILISMIIVSAIYPLQEMALVLRSYKIGELQHNVKVDSLSLYSDLESDEISWKYNYYTYDLENDLFVNYISKKKNSPLNIRISSC